MLNRSKYHFALACLGALAMIAPIHATPTEIDLVPCSGSETVEGFESLAPFTKVTTQLTGVTFSGGGSNDRQVRNYSTSPASSAALATAALGLGLGTQGIVHDFGFTVDFSTPQNRVGFYFGSKFPINVPFQTFLGGSATGDFNLIVSANQPSFFGYEDAAGIDRLVFGEELTANYPSMLDDLRFEAAEIPVAAVPEPSTILLLGTGLFGLAAYRRRRAA